MEHHYCQHCQSGPQCELANHNSTHKCKHSLLYCVGCFSPQMDLRSIGDQSLSAEVVRSQTGEVMGQCVLQIQRVKNVAMPSTKQHLPSPSKRMLRFQLTDGKEYVNAIETDGHIDKLRCDSVLVITIT